MRFLSYVVILALGGLLGYFIKSYGVIHGPYSSQISYSLPELHITYSDFVSILLTLVTIVLAAVAIGIGVIAAYTFREIKDDARKAVKIEVEKRLEDLPDTIRGQVNRVAFKSKQTTSIEELEPGFDPSGTGER